MFAWYLSIITMAKKEIELENIAWALKALESVQSTNDNLICKEVKEQSPELAELLEQAWNRIDRVLHTERTTLEYYKKLTEERA